MNYDNLGYDEDMERNDIHSVNNGYFNLNDLNLDNDLHNDNNINNTFDREINNTNNYNENMNMNTNNENTNMNKFNNNSFPIHNFNRKNSKNLKTNKENENNNSNSDEISDSQIMQREIFQNYCDPLLNTKKQKKKSKSKNKMYNKVKPSGKFNINKNKEERITNKDQLKQNNINTFSNEIIKNNSITNKDIGSNRVRNSSDSKQKHDKNVKNSKSNTKNDHYNRSNTKNKSKSKSMNKKLSYKDGITSQQISNKKSIDLGLKTENASLARLSMNHNIKNSFNSDMGILKQKVKLAERERQDYMRKIDSYKLHIKNLALEEQRVRFLLFKRKLKNCYH